MRSVEFEKIADLLARQHTINVRPGKAWAANIEKRIVFYRKNDIYDLPEDQILGMLLHEIAHIHYTEIIKLPDKNPEITGLCTNMLEDISIEHIIGKDYPNAEEILQSSKDGAINELLKILPKMENISDHEKTLLYAAIKFEGRGDSNNISPYEKLGEEIAKIMIKEKDTILNRKKTSDLLPLATRIIEILIKKFGEPSDKDKRRMQQELQDHTKAEEDSRNSQSKNKTIKALAGKGYKGDEKISCQVSFIGDIYDKAKMIGRKLRKILKRNNAMEYGGRYRTGKLMTRRLARIKTTKDNKPFGRRIIKSNQSYAFAIASDVSGSMFGGLNPQDHAGSYALSSLCMVGEALRTASTPRSLILFGTKAVTINPINKLQLKWSQIATEKLLNTAGQGSTNINLAIKNGRTELNKVKAEKKIIIILTDGSSDPYTVKEEYRKTQKEGIQCKAIIIGDDNSTLHNIMDKKDIIEIKDLTNNNEIGEAFIQILQTTITKST